MRAVVIARQGTPVARNVRLVDDWPDPRPEPGQVVVRCEASALNHRDLSMGAGLPGREVTYPLLTGEDGCGIVESVGSGVDPGWVGRRVVVNAAMPLPEPIRPDIALAEKFAAAAANVLDVGESDPAEAAAFGLVHLTAWRMLVTRAGLRAGQTVLIPGIGGGVALALLGICRHFGCTTIVTSRHAWKLDRARTLGADHAVLDTGDFSREVRPLTGRRGVDICADSIGKAVHLQCLRCLARGGILVTCGATTGGDPVTDLVRIYWNECAILGSTMGTMEEFREVVALFRRGLLRPVVDGVFDPADAAEAFARLESGDQFGKIVLQWA
jgi:NADPH:quinone reductase-like Zn-dependent oxidoreductase